VLPAPERLATRRPGTARTGVIGCEARSPPVEARRAPRTAVVRRDRSRTNISIRACRWDGRLLPGVFRGARNELMVYHPGREVTMPILNVKVSARPDAKLAATVAETLTELTVRILRKRRELTAVAVDFVPREHWIVGGRSLTELDKHSFYFDIKIVDGTNTKDEKAQYVAESFDAFSKLLGDLHAESYVYVQDVRAEAYGFGGLTQEYRYIEAKLGRER
jgi:4-oxalocrotonate tautomerase